MSLIESLNESLKNSNSTIKIDQNPQQSHVQKHISIGDIIKSFVYGGLDGCVNTLIIIITSFASQKQPKMIMSLCLAAVVGDAIGMGLGDYLSALAQIKYIKKEEERQYYEINHIKQQQIKQLVDVYQQKGFSYEDSLRVSELFSTNDKAFVNTMMLEQLGLVVIQQVVALKCGITTFISFLVFGTLPLLPYIITVSFTVSNQHNIIFSTIIGAILLFGLGFIKAKIIGGKKLKSSLQTLFLGLILCGIGFGVGVLFSQ